MLGNYDERFLIVVPLRQVIDLLAKDTRSKHEVRAAKGVLRVLQRNIWRMIADRVMESKVIG